MPSFQSGYDVYAMAAHRAGCTQFNEDFASASAPQCRKSTRWPPLNRRTQAVPTGHDKYQRIVRIITGREALVRSTASASTSFESPTPHA